MLSVLLLLMMVVVVVILVLHMPSDAVVGANDPHVWKTAGL